MKGRILHIAGGLTLQTLYHNIFIRFSGASFAQDIYVPCNSLDKIGRNRVDIPDTHYEYQYVGGLLDRLLFIPKAKKHFKRMCSRFKMQTVQHCFAYTVMTDGSLAYQLKKKHRVPYSVFVRNTDINIFYKYFFWLRPLFHAILRDAEYINFPNPSYRDRLYERLDSKFVKQLHEKTRIIPNGIDDYWHENSLQVDKLKRPEGKPVRLLFVGKVETNKNVHSIVAALPRLNTDHNFHLTVIGPIAEDRKADVTRWCDELGDALSIKGPIYDKEQLLKEYRDADIFVMPSFTETFGLVFIEALTQGLPIIYTKGEGVSGFFVSVNNGLEIENPKDVDELASKIQRIVENYDHFSSHTLQSAKMFKWDNIILNYLQQVGNHENTKHN